MPINAVAAVLAVPQPAAATAQQSAGESMTSALQSVLQTEQSQAAGGGGHRAHKPALEVMSQIAASQNAKPKVRAKSVQDRQAEIERMKEEQRHNPGERDLADDRNRRRPAWQHDNELNPLTALF